ncbi:MULTISPECIES: helix-turn-helix transcriptional regulator [unclassified Candidatus Tisiphia]|uniref:helix-turn-helix transcriptional regulator n=1 Tax=unclassified Candidatus Tisiphia TaxID=2996318 RepID=UPI00312CC0CC
MGWSENIKDFLAEELKKRGLKVSELAEHAGIPQTTMRGMLENRRPEIKNIIKLANYFDCSIDKMLGREEFVSSEKQQYAQLSPEELSANLKSFINKELVKNNLTQYELGSKIGRSDDAVRPFLREGDNNQKMLTTETVVAVADYFKVSIDGVLGRVPQLAKEQQLAKPLDNSLKNLTPEALKAAQLIGKSIENKVSADGKAASTHVRSVNKMPSNDRSR